MARGQSKLPRSHHLTIYTKHPAAPVPDFAVMRRADFAWRDRRNCESGPRVPIVTPKFHRNSFYDFFFFRRFDGVEFCACP